MKAMKSFLKVLLFIILFSLILELYVRIAVTIKAAYHDIDFYWVRIAFPDFTPRHSVIGIIIASIVIMVIISIRYYNDHFYVKLKLRKFYPLSGLVALLLSVVLFTSVISLFHVLTNAGFNPPNSFTFFEPLNLEQESLYLLGLLVVVGTFLDQWLFRGYLFDKLEESGYSKAKMILFSVIFYLIFSFDFTLLGFTLIVFVNVILGLVFVYSNNLWLVMIAHFGFNGLSLLYRIERFTILFDSFITNHGLFFFISAVIIAIMIYILHKLYLKSPEKTYQRKALTVEV
jgi:membrane protease YdiL (CAAX protease family)